MRAASFAILPTAPVVYALNEIGQCRTVQDTRNGIADLTHNDPRAAKFHVIAYFARLERRLAGTRQRVEHQLARERSRLRGTGVTR